MQMQPHLLKGGGRGEKWRADTGQSHFACHASLAINFANEHTTSAINNNLCHNFGTREKYNAKQ